MVSEQASPHFHLDVADMEGFKHALANRDGATNLPELTLKQVEAGTNALYTLPSLVQKFASIGSRSILLVQDRRSFIRAGNELKSFVRTQLEQAGFGVEVLEMGDERGYLHSNFAEVEQIRPHLHPDKTAIALGSGKICDVTKHA